MQIILKRKMLCALLAAVSCSLSAATTYDVQFIDFPGASGTFPTALNNGGVVAGYYVDGISPFEKGFRWDATFGHTTINYPGATFTRPEGINDAGQIVGTTQVQTTPTILATFGFLFSGSFTPFAILGAGPFGAAGINNAGTIVGSYIFGPESFGYSLSGGVYSLVNAPGVLYSDPTDINDAGQIVGNTYLPERGFLLQGGVYSQLLPPGYFFSRVLGVNNLGQFVGTARLSEAVPEEPLFFDGVSFVPFSLPGLSFIELRDINDKGQLVGVAFDGTNTRAFLATPTVEPPPPTIVPEPSTAALGLIACVLVGAASKRRKR
jgi:uncharacterized membrane protein